MTNIQACEFTLKEGVTLIRYRKDSVTPTAPPQYDVKGGFTGKKRGWIYLDTFTASAIMAVYKALSPEEQKKVLRWPFAVLADFAFKHVR